MEAYKAHNKITSVDTSGNGRRSQRNGFDTYI